MPVNTPHVKQYIKDCYDIQLKLDELDDELFNGQLPAEVYDEKKNALENDWEKAFLRLNNYLRESQ